MPLIYLIGGVDHLHAQYLLMACILTVFCFLYPFEDRLSTLYKDYFVYRVWVLFIFFFTATGTIIAYCMPWGCHVFVCYSWFWRRISYALLTIFLWMFRTISSWVLLASSLEVAPCVAIGTEGSVSKTTFWEDEAPKALRCGSCYQDLLFMHLAWSLTERWRGSSAFLPGMVELCASAYFWNDFDTTVNIPVYLRLFTLYEPCVSYGQQHKLVTISRLECFASLLHLCCNPHLVTYLWVPWCKISQHRTMTVLFVPFFAGE